MTCAWNSRSQTSERGETSTPPGLLSTCLKHLPGIFLSSWCAQGNLFIQHNNPESLVRAGETERGDHRAIQSWGLALELHSRPLCCTATLRKIMGSPSSKHTLGFWTWPNSYLLTSEQYWSLHQPFKSLYRPINLLLLAAKHITRNRAYTPFTDTDSKNTCKRQSEPAFW